MEMEEAFYFENQGEKIFAMLHYPSQSDTDSHQNTKTGLVFCPAFADEDFRTHRELVVFARMLAREGYVILRFDYRGSGDSYGSFEDYTLKDRLSDIQTAIEILRERREVDRVGLLGLRFGGDLAAAVAARNKEIESLILWAPIVDVGNYFSLMLKSQMAHELGNFGKVISKRKTSLERLENGGNFDLMANIITSELYKELNLFEPYDRAGHSLDNVLIVGIQGDTTRPATLESLVKKYPSADIQIVKEKLFWFDKVYQNPLTLFDITSRWLADRHMDKKPENLRMRIGSASTK